MSGALQQLARLHELPSPPGLLQRILAIAADSDRDAGALEEAIKMDPAIAARTLRLANSAYIGLPRSVSSLHNAVVILGGERIQSLVIAAGLLGALRPSGPLIFELSAFWKHAICVGIISESLSRHLRRYCALDPGEAFCAGLIHDIGKLGLAMTYPDPVAQSYTRAMERSEPLHAVEQHPYAHTSAGEVLAQAWRLPAVLRAALRYHHDPRAVGDDHRVVSIVHLADFMAHILGYQTVAFEPAPSVDNDTLEGTGLPLERLRSIAEKAVEDQRRIETIAALTE
jgi:HD-like signal output (HDOD) protein